MNEEVSDKTVNLAVQVLKPTLRNVAGALRKGVEQYKNTIRIQKVAKQNAKTNKPPKKGKQTVKELVGQGQGVSSIPIGDTGLKDFKKIANKYGVDFAIVKDKTGKNPKYTVFFKAKDADAITSVLNELSAKQMKRQKKKVKAKTRAKTKAKTKTKGKTKSQSKIKAKTRPSLLQKLRALKDKVASIPRKQKEKKKELDR